MCGDIPEDCLLELDFDREFDVYLAKELYRKDTNEKRKMGAGRNSSSGAPCSIHDKNSDSGNNKQTLFDK